MQRRILPLLLFALASLNANAQYTQYVNPFTGTDFHGHTFPGACLPFGMVQLSPDTRIDTWDGCSGYHYSDSLLYGFSHTHLSGTGCSDYGDILLMPVHGLARVPVDRTCYASPFCHEREAASPGYYEVFLDKWRVNVRLTAGLRSGFHQYGYPPRVQPQVLLDLNHRDEVLSSHIETCGPRSLRGYRRSRAWARDQIVYFYIQFSRDMTSFSLADSTQALIGFDASAKNILQARVGISPVSEENARANLLADMHSWNFERQRKHADAAWNAYLGLIEVESENLEDIKTFYTALYHTAMAPNLFSDVNGDYRDMQRRKAVAEGYEHYTVFSLWDTYRTLHPLFTLIQQQRTRHFMQTLLADALAADKKLPVWELSCNETDCMIGFHSVSVLADALTKGIGGVDVNKALDCALSSSEKPEYGIPFFNENGFIPAEKEHESVSKTLEYAYDNWCIAQMAVMAGRPEVYKTCMERAQYYKNIFDGGTGFMRPKMYGRWLPDFDPAQVNNHFTEANSWQYSFYVPQDIETHMKLMGGEAAYIARLDTFFTTTSRVTGRQQADITGLVGQYAHGNEPSQQAAYLYAYAGAPYKTQARVREILNTLYSARPDGLCGNDDCGQMSAWYVMSAMGLYPVCPGNPQYVLTSPLFDRIRIALENGREILITRDSPHVYVQNLTLNGAPYNRSYIDHQTLMRGARLHYTLGPEPDVLWASRPAERPRSRIEVRPIVENPWFAIDSVLFLRSAQVSLHSRGERDALFVAVDEEPFSLYTRPFSIDRSARLRAYAQNPDGRRSFVVESRVTKLREGYKVRLLSRYNPQYDAGGPRGLVDGRRGLVNFRLGGWQGYQESDFEAIVDLGEIRRIHRVGAGFLQDVRSWIWLPLSVSFAVSDDGRDFRELGTAGHTVDERDYTPQILDLQLQNIDVAARYVKVKALRYGTIPSWHLGAGGEGFIFIDEIWAE